MFSCWRSSVNGNDSFRSFFGIGNRLTSSFKYQHMKFDEETFGTCFFLAVFSSVGAVTDLSIFHIARVSAWWIKPLSSCCKGYYCMCVTVLCFSHLEGLMIFDVQVKIKTPFSTPISMTVHR